MTNGGWPNLMENSKRTRNKSPSSSNNIADLIEDRDRGPQQILMNGNADQELHHHHLPSINEITNNTTAKKHVENCDSGWGIDHSSSRLVTTATTTATATSAPLSTTAERSTIYTSKTNKRESSIAKLEARVTCDEPKSRH